MKWKLILIFIGVGIIFLLGALILSDTMEIKMLGIGGEAEVTAYALEGNGEYTPSTETHCNGNKCYKVLYSGVRFVEENNQWKKIEDAWRLGGAEGLFWDIDLDPSFNITIGNYNYTYFENLCFSSNITGNIPLKIYRYNESNESQIINEINAVIPNPIPNQVRCFNITLQKPILAYWVDWGFNSTTIQLQDNETENLGDSYVSLSSPSTNYGTSTTNWIYKDTTSGSTRRVYSKFNISSIPDGQAIDEAIFSFYISTFYNSAHPENFEVHHVKDYTWDGQDDSSITWDNQVCGTAFDDSGDCNLVAEDSISPDQAFWWSMDISDMVSEEYSGGDLNISFALKLDNEVADGDSYGGKLASEEMLPSSYRPYLNITYLVLVSSFWEDWEDQDFVNWTDVVDWQIASDQKIDSYSAKCAAGDDCNMSVGVLLDTTDLDINVSFYYFDDDCDDGDVIWYWRNSTGHWVSQGNIDGDTLSGDDAWYQHIKTSSDPQYQFEGFSVRFFASPLGGENYWLDNINISTSPYEAPTDCWADITGGIYVPSGCTYYMPDNDYIT